MSRKKKIRGFKRKMNGVKIGVVVDEYRTNSQMIMDDMFYYGQAIVDSNGERIDPRNVVI